MRSALCSVLLVAIPFLLGSSCVGELFVVTTTDDLVDSAPGDGLCETAAGNCSLRAAIQEANALPLKQRVELPAGVYTLSLPVSALDDAGGDLDIQGSLLVDGDGADTTVVHGAGIDRVFQVGAGVVELRELTIQGGEPADGLGGGGVRAENDALLTLKRVSLVSNAAGQGGGLYAQAGAQVHVHESAIVYNHASDGGGGFANAGVVNVRGSTIGANYSTDGAGGVLQLGGETLLVNATVHANTGPGGCAVGAEDQGVFEAQNTILSCLDSSSVCSFAITSLGHNIGSDLSCDLVEPGDMEETDPGLTAGGASIGSTFVYELSSASPAIDAGVLPNGPPPPTDQPGGSRPADGNGDFALEFDIGAAEYSDLKFTFPHKLYVAAKNAERTHVINTTTFTSNPSLVHLGAEPVDVMANPFLAQVDTTEQIEDVIRIDTATNLPFTFTIGDSPQTVGYAPYLTLVSGSGITRLIPQRDIDELGVVDVASNAYLGSFVGNGLNQPSDIAMTPDGTKAYVVNDGSNSISWFEVAGGSSFGQIAVCDNPRAVATHPNFGFAYVACEPAAGGGVLSVINTTLNVVAATVPVGGFPRDVAVARDGSNVFVADFLGGVIVLDGVGFAVVDTISLPLGTERLEPGIVPDTLYVTEDGAVTDWVYKVRVSTGGILGSIGLAADAPRGMAVR